MLTKNSFSVFLLLLFNTPSIVAATLDITIKSSTGEAVENAVITLSNEKTNSVVTKSSTYVIDQIDKAFVPAVITIPQGSKINFPNKDNIRHHVYSFSKSKQFELPLYEGTPARPISFDKSGIVVLGCNIHDWMRGYIFISDTPYFAQTDKSGNTKIKNIANGKYTLRIWHPQISTYEDKSAEVIIHNNKNMTYSEVIDLKPAIKIRRAPAFRRREY